MTTKYEGITVTLGGEARVLPPLTLRALRKLNPQIRLLATLAEGLPTEEQIIAISEVVHASLVRNYPDVTVDQVEEWLDMSNLGLTIGAVMAVAGLERRGADAGGAERPGK